MVEISSFKNIAYTANNFSAFFISFFSRMMVPMQTSYICGREERMMTPVLIFAMPCVPCSRQNIENGTEYGCPWQLAVPPRCSHTQKVQS